MNVMIKAAKSLFKIAYWKCRYGSRLRMPWIQGFDQVYLELSKNGHMSFGERNENRGRMHFICAGDGRLEIGNHVIYAIGGSITCMGHIKIGDYCRLGNNVVIVDHDHNFKNQGGEFLIGEITIGNRVWVGANCTILKGARIGDDCVIAAGSVVKGEVPAGSLFYQKRESCVKRDCVYRSKEGERQES